MAGLLIPLFARAVRLTRDCAGSVAAETALVAGLLVALLAQVLDYGWMAFCKVQVHMAAQAAVAHAAAKCYGATLQPATINCGAGLQTEMQTAANEVAIGNTTTNTITITAMDEKYYCPDSANDDELVEVGDPDPSASFFPPADCSAYGLTDMPGDYVSATVSYNFSPLFPGLSLTSYSSSGVMTANGWIRID